MGSDNTHLTDFNNRIIGSMILLEGDKTKRNQMIRDKKINEKEVYDSMLSNVNELLIRQTRIDMSDKTIKKYIIIQVKKYLHDLPDNLFLNRMSKK